MLDVNIHGETLDEIGFSTAMVRFLTEHERGQLEQLVTRHGRGASDRDLEHVGRLMYTACRRADMRHPGFE